MNAFERAIAANLMDQLPRLIYMDDLSERSRKKAYSYQKRICSILSKAEVIYRRGPILTKSLIKEIYVSTGKAIYTVGVTDCVWVGSGVRIRWVEQFTVLWRNGDGYTADGQKYRHAMEALLTCPIPTPIPGA